MHSNDQLAGKPQGDSEQTGAWASTKNSDIPPALAEHPRYSVLRLLGQGGMGAVYLAQHTVMDRPVAVKLVRLDGRSSSQEERFHREVKVAAQLDHPNIVRAFDAEKVGGIHLLVMEYVEGDDLAHLMKSKGPLSVFHACDFVRQAALGLQHAHEKGMVHRDIKPANLMVTAAGLVKILDFGLARFLRAKAPEEQETASGVVMGTPDYMAPEQANDSHAADIRADIYSLGCTLYQFLTGQLPFPGGGFLDKLRKHANEAPAPLGQWRSDLPNDLVVVVERMMAKRPEDRYQTPGEVADALTPFCRTDSTGAASKNREQPVTEAYWARPVATNRRVKKTIWLGVGGAVAACLIVLLAFLAFTGKVDQGKVKDASFNPEVPANAGQQSKVADEVLDFQTLHGATAVDLEAWVEGLKKPDYCPVYISIQAGCLEPRFNAIAVDNGKRISYQYKFRMTPAVAMDFFMECQEKRFHPLFGLEYRDANAVTWFQFWRKESIPFASWGDNLPSIKTKIREASGTSMRPNYFICSQIGTPDSFHVGFIEKDRRAWEARFDMDLAEVSDLFRAQRLKQWRPELLYAYWDGSGVKFITVLIENQPLIDWDHQFDLPTEELTTQLAEQKRLGFRPLSITSYGNLATPRYAVVWQRYRSPE